jgi:hypothetical protein
LIYILDLSPTLYRWSPIHLTWFLQPLQFIIAFVELCMAHNTLTCYYLRTSLDENPDMKSGIFIIPFYVDISMEVFPKLHTSLKSSFLPFLNFNTAKHLEMKAVHNFFQFLVNVLSVSFSVLQPRDCSKHHNKFLKKLYARYS